MFANSMLGYLLFAVPPLLLGLVAQSWLKRTFAEGSRIPSHSGLTGAQVSRRLLDSGGLGNVGIEPISGQLSDHYDPRAKVMRLSQPVGNQTSIAAVAVAAHETGHAFQDSRGEAFFRLRGAIVPVVNIASQGWYVVLLAGALLGSLGLIKLAVVLFVAVVAFQLITLPVEFGASHKALGMLTAQGILTPDEVPVARKVLTAAAMTYVVAALVAVYQLLLLYLSSQRN